jgi:hypothetical protein
MLQPICGNQQVIPAGRGSPALPRPAPTKHNKGAIMNKETFKAQLTTLCATALASGVIDLQQFTQLVQIEVQPVTKTLKSVKTGKTNFYGTAVHWTEEMIRTAVHQSVQGKSKRDIAASMRKEFNVMLSTSAVGAMLSKIRSGSIFEMQKYQSEPWNSIIRDCRNILNAGLQE